MKRKLKVEAQEKVSDGNDIYDQPVVVESDDGRIEKMIVATTAGGKEIQIKRDNLGLWFVEFSSGGQLPAELSGKYTEWGIAKTAVEFYLVNA